MIGRHKFKVGMRVKLSAHGRSSFVLPKTRRNARGTVTKVDEINFPTVRWDHRKTASGYHPMFIAPASAGGRQ